MLAGYNRIGPGTLEYLRVPADIRHETIWVGRNPQRVAHNVHKLAYDKIHHCHCYARTNGGEETNNFEDAIEGFAVGEDTLFHVLSVFLKKRRKSSFRDWLLTRKARKPEVCCFSGSGVVADKCDAVAPETWSGFSILRR